MTTSTAKFRFDVKVLEYDTYGTRIIEVTQASIVAKDKAELTEKVRAVFNAKYDSFREFWSHSYSINGVSEE